MQFKIYICMCTLSESAASTEGVNAIPLSTRVNLTIDMWRKIIKFALTSLNLPLFSLDNLGDNHQTCLNYFIFDNCLQELATNVFGGTCNNNLKLQPL